MDKPEIQAVEMTRRIRAQHADELREATPEERIRFYREKARWVDQGGTSRGSDERPSDSAAL